MSEAWQSPSWLKGAVFNLEPLVLIVVVVVAHSQIPDNINQLSSHVKDLNASYHVSWAMLGCEYISFHLVSNFSSKGESTPS